MATGTTSDFLMTRDDLVSAALRKITRLKGSESPSAVILTNAVEALNVIIRQEDLKNTRQSKDLWAMTESHLILVANQVTYSSSDGLETNIRDIDSASYRDANGDDVPVKIIAKAQYEAIQNKNDTGDVQKIYLTEDRLLSSRVMHIWPAVASAGTTSEVTGTDALNYSCIMGHESANLNKPITGSDYSLYWRQTGSSGSAWVTGTDYTNGKILRYSYKKPLFDFDSATDNPDMPSGWNKFLIFQLASDLGPEHGIDLETQKIIDFRAKEARQELFGSTVEVTTDIHNKGVFF